MSTYQAAQSPGVELAISCENVLYKTMQEEETALLEELLGLKAKLLIKWAMPNGVVQNPLEEGMTLVHLVEIEIEHSRSFSPVGLYCTREKGSIAHFS